MENPLRKHPLGKGKGNWETPGLGVKGVFNKWRGGGNRRSSDHVQFEAWYRPKLWQRWFDKIRFNVNVSHVGGKVPQNLVR